MTVADVAVRVVVAYGLWFAAASLAFAVYLWLALHRGRHHTPEPPVWVNDGVDFRCEVCAFEREIRTPGRLEQAIAEELAS